jgi:hypothetical protein
MMYPYSKKQEKLLHVFYNIYRHNRKQSEVQDKLHDTNTGKLFTAMTEKAW